MDDERTGRILWTWRRNTPEKDAMRLAFEAMVETAKHLHSAIPGVDGRKWRGPAMNAFAHRVGSLSYAAQLNPGFCPYWGPNDRVDPPSDDDFDAVRSAIGELEEASLRLVGEIDAAEMPGRLVGDLGSVEVESVEARWPGIVRAVGLRLAAQERLGTAMARLRCGKRTPPLDGPGQMNDPGAESPGAPVSARRPAAICALNAVPAATAGSLKPLVCVLADDGTLWAGVADAGIPKWIRLPDLPGTSGIEERPAAAAVEGAAK